MIQGVKDTAVVKRPRTPNGRMCLSTTRSSELHPKWRVWNNSCWKDASPSYLIRAVTGRKLVHVSQKKTKLRRFCFQKGSLCRTVNESRGQELLLEAVLVRRSPRHRKKATDMSDGNDSSPAFLGLVAISFLVEVRGKLPESRKLAVPGVSSRGPTVLGAHSQQDIPVRVLFAVVQ